MNNSKSIKMTIFEIGFLLFCGCLLTANGQQHHHHQQQRSLSDRGIQGPFVHAKRSRQRRGIVPHRTIRHGNDACDFVDFKTTQVEDFVNILGGTNSRYDMSFGATLPLISRPYGFNSWSPQTDNDPTWPGFWFHPSDYRYFGLRLTHQPSPWIGDYGYFLIKTIMPSESGNSSAAITKDLFTGYKSSDAVFTPYYFATELYSYGNSKGNVFVEFTPTNHGGILQTSYPPYIAHETGDGSQGSGYSQLRRVSIVLNGGKDYLQVIKSPLDGTTLLQGMTTANHGGTPSDFALYFVVAVYCGAEGADVTSVPTDADGPDSVYLSGTTNWVDFSPLEAKHDTLTLRIATSFISLEQALLNLQQEVSSKDSFQQLLEDSRKSWQTTLSRARIAEPPTIAASYSLCELLDIYTVYYTSLYRASLFPRQLSEVDATGRLVHWSPYNSRVSDGPLSSDSGFWDAWNTVYPLLTLINKPALKASMQGWLNSYLEGGWLPKWASPGYRSSMIGTMADVSIADAIVKGMFSASQAELAYQAIRKDAFELPPIGVEGVGRVCLEGYLKYGYIPRHSPMTTGGECYDVVSRTLNYLHSDFALSQAAWVLNKTDDYRVLSDRAKNYTKVFDAQTGFFRAKELNERWVEPFDQFGWGTDYTEGGPWAYRFYVPWDVEGLKQLYQRSGRDFCATLQATQTLEHSTIHVGGNDVEIKEQTELVANCWGQYAHNDQPSHHMLFMHFFDGHNGACAQQGRAWIKRALLELYDSGEAMYPGDEDNGEMGAWFVLASVGLYARSPGSLDAEYQFASPLFGRVELDISESDDGRSDSKRLLVIEARNSGKDHTQIARVLWNNELLPSSANGISYELLRQGGTLTFEMI